MKILLDECVDRRLARDLVGHSVSTAQKMGWSGIKNGELLARAQKDFDIFITVDRQISTQQNLTKFDIAVVLIRSRSNRLADIRQLVPELLEAINRAIPTKLMTVGER